jgi:peptidoglycan/xylan/chitin deacetylase (PgdA/CDA1 family)
MPRSSPLIRLAACTALLLALLAATAPGAGAPGGASPGAKEPPVPSGPQPLELRQARLTQDNAALVLRVETAEPWSPASLRRNEQSLCLRLVYQTDAVNSRDVCVRRRGAKTTMTYARVLRDGGTGPLHPLEARIARPSKRSLVARFAPAKLGIPYGSLRWRVIASTDGCAIAGERPCFVAMPEQLAELRLSAPKPVGCTPAGPAYITSGPRGKRVVALTFDDGPSSHTPAVLDILRRENVRATFFMLGQQVGGYASLVQRMMAEGHELANHTWSHPNVSGGGSLASQQVSNTNAAIQRVGGFRPCHFRAPYGAIGGGLISLVRGLGMTTVQWDVDTNDWQLPGADAIYSRIVNGVRNGSIVLMHDGGGPRGQTVAALPRAIQTLKARGYRFVTVAELTGAALRY